MSHLSVSDITIILGMELEIALLYILFHYFILLTSEFIKEHIRWTCARECVSAFPVTYQHWLNQIRPPFLLFL